LGLRNRLDKKSGYRLLTKLIKEVGLTEKHRKANFDVEIAVDAKAQIIAISTKSNPLGFLF